MSSSYHSEVCGNCFHYRVEKLSPSQGDCCRHPPQVLVIPGTRKSLQISGLEQVQIQLQMRRPTLPSNYPACGDFQESQSYRDQKRLEEPNDQAKD